MTLIEAANLAIVLSGIGAWVSIIYIISRLHRGWSKGYYRGKVALIGFSIVLILALVTKYYFAG